MEERNKGREKKFVLNSSALYCMLQTSNKISKREKVFQQVKSRFFSTALFFFTIEGFFYMTLVFPDVNQLHKKFQHLSVLPDGEVDTFFLHN